MQPPSSQNSSKRRYSIISQVSSSHTLHTPYSSSSTTSSQRPIAKKSSRTSLAAIFRRFSTTLSSDSGENDTDTNSPPQSERTVLENSFSGLHPLIQSSRAGTQPTLIQDTVIENASSPGTEFVVDTDDPSNLGYTRVLRINPARGINNLTTDNPLSAETRDNDFDDMDSHSQYVSDTDQEPSGEDSGDDSEDSDDSFIRTARVERLADIQDQLLNFRRFGCGPAVHKVHQEAHLDGEPEDSHYPLAGTYECHQPYQRPGGAKHVKLGLDATGFPKPEDLARQYFINGRNIRQITDGIVPSSSENAVIKNICLHQEPQPSFQLKQEFDIDGVFVKVPSFRGILTEVNICLTKQVRYNITSDVRLSHRVTSVDTEGRSSSRSYQLRYIPHLYIGSIQQLRNGAVFMFFPWLMSGDKKSKKTSWLSDKDADRFITRVFLAAYESIASTGLSQHIPGSFKDADLRALAKGYEHQSINRERGLKQHREIPIPHDILHQIESVMFDIIQDPDNGVYDFRDSFVLVNAKNTKLDFKMDAAWQTIDKFFGKIDEAFDRDMRTVYGDIGEEIYPCPSNTGIDGVHQSSEPCVLLWKACCLQKTADDLKRKAFENSPGMVNIYHNSFLRDSTCMTIVPPARSWSRKAGWLYAQWYTSVKLIEDANKVYPFNHPQLVNLCLDESLHHASTYGNSRSTLMKSYMGSKDRVSVAFDAATPKSYGDRVEFRDIEAGLKALADLSRRRDHPVRRSLSDPQPFLWAIHTSAWVEFMKSNYHKWTSLIELIILTSPTTGVSLKSAQLIFILLTCLQNFGNCDLRRTGLLRFTDKEVDGTTLYGLGLQSTIERHGFGWFAERVDWERLQIRDQFDGSMLGIGEKIGRYYRVGCRLAQATYGALDVCYQELRLSTTFSNPTRLARVLEVIGHLILRQYRREFLDAIGKGKNSILIEEYEDEHRKDEVKFSFDGLKVALTKEPYLISGGKTQCKHPVMLFEWLMGTGKEWTRDFMDNTNNKGEMKQWRKSIHKMKDLVKAHPGLRLQWDHCLQRLWRNFFWIAPYPDTNGSFISTASKKPGTRNFYSTDVLRSGDWVWAGKEYRKGMPPDWPTFLNMDDTALKSYLTA